MLIIKYPESSIDYHGWTLFIRHGIASFFSKIRHYQVTTRDPALTLGLYHAKFPFIFCRRSYMGLHLAGYQIAADPGAPDFVGWLPLLPGFADSIDLLSFAT